MVGTLLRSSDNSSIRLRPKNAPSIKYSIRFRLSLRIFRLSRPWNDRPWISTNLFLFRSKIWRFFITEKMPLGKEESLWKINTWLSHSYMQKPPNMMKKAWLHSVLLKTNIFHLFLASKSSSKDVRLSRHPVSRDTIRFPFKFSFLEKRQ